MCVGHPGYVVDAMNYIEILPPVVISLTHTYPTTPTLASQPHALSVLVHYLTSMSALSLATLAVASVVLVV